ncbi:hypothetical protein L486_08512 [Kwoniella mangroviensis CBS 10435]|uniref:F-box domain-containing protein n=1 Tax=Kwoniella mangroviensis CBS 10435 TaxID=1331196 RepID=A0A1B9IEN9_9TREE|nr:hypothetical protein L486_08512 [Kwoniella mangroviensis CBS 10435]
MKKSKISIGPTAFPGHQPGAPMSSLKDLFDKKHLPEEVLQQILIYLKDIAPSLFLRLSHDLYDKYVSSVYRSVRLSGENVESFLYGAMKTPGLGHIEETYEGCGVHKHEINIDWYSDKTHALSLVRKLEFTDVESMKKFSQIVGDKKEFSYGFSGRERTDFSLDLDFARGGTRTIHTYLGRNKQFTSFFGTLRVLAIEPSLDICTPLMNPRLSSGEKEVLCSKNVEYIPLDYSHIIEKEATNVVEMFKCSIGGIIDRAKRKNHSGPVKLQCFVPSRYTIGLRSLVDHKMKEAVGKVEPDRGHWSVNGDEYVRRWQEYVEIMDLEGSDVCESCGRH